MMIYNIPNGDSTIRVQFNRKLFEYPMQTNGGRSKTKTKGILSNCERPAKACVIFDKEFLREVKSLCKHFKIKSKFYKVEKL